MTALGFSPSLLFVQVIALYPNHLRTQNPIICVAEEQLYCSNRERTNLTFVGWERKGYCFRYRESKEAQDKASLQVEHKMKDGWVTKLLQQ